MSASVPAPSRVRRIAGRALTVAAFVLIFAALILPNVPAYPVLFYGTLLAGGVVPDREAQEVRPAHGAQGVTANEKAFRVMVRTAMFRRVELVAYDRYGQLGELEQSVAQLSAVYRAFVRVGSLPVPTVGVVVGGAVGAGLNLALAVDLLVTTPDSVLDSGFLARGIHPGGGHLTLLNRAVGRADTIALAVCGQSLSGAQAVERGLAYAAAPVPDIPAIGADLTGPAARDPELTRRVMASVRLELGPPAVTWDSAIEIERGVQMWSMARKGQNWSSRGPGRS